MASYKDFDEAIDNSKVSWGSVDFGSADQSKKDSLRQSWWATNRAAYGIWDIVRDLAPKVNGLVTSAASAATELVRIRTYAARTEQKLDALTAKLSEVSAKLDKPA